MADLQQTLATLLSGGKDASRDHKMRLVRKHGRPLLLLPPGSRLAAQTLALYPAQTLPARLAREALRNTLVFGLLFGVRKFPVSVSPANAFVQFLSSSIHQNGALESAPIPPFGVLLGNPNAPGQRLVFLVFDATGKPAAIVKAGITDEARRLIRREREFLEAAPAISGIPRLRGRFESPAAGALAMDFVEGDSPREGAERNLPELLTSWIQPGALVPIEQTRVWAELKQSCGALPLFADLTSELQGKTVNSVVFHGDLTPWNIKASSGGKWTVFDWERGDPNGLPGYDWFHYLIQTRILVTRKSTPALVAHLEQFLSSAEFQRYAVLTRISGIERQMAMAYLLHHNEVIRPGEGLNEGRELLKALIERRHSK